MNPQLDTRLALHRRIDLHGEAQEAEKRGNHAMAAKRYQAAAAVCPIPLAVYFILQEKAAQAAARTQG